MQDLRLGIIGLGNMGQFHANAIAAGKIAHCQLAAVCDRDERQLGRYLPARGFLSSSELINSGEVDATLIATPHYSHTTIGIEALGSGLHVLIEKPLSVHKADCERLLAAHRGTKQVFATMFNQRTDPFYLKLREMIRNDELGTIRRINWIVTHWFRTAVYYASSGWRATWAGEGGGVLLNQSPHQLDLWQWLFGMPSKVRAFCQFGRYHDIEVEDDVTAYFEYDNGTTGVLITSTGEAPGTDRLEIAAERGRVIIENDRFHWTRNEVPMSEFSKQSPDAFAKPATSEMEIPLAGRGGQHNEVLQNFVDAILFGERLIAPAEEGIHSVELANAMLFSSDTDTTVSLPLNAGLFERWLSDKIKNSSFRKADVRASDGDLADFSKSFER
ncbi:MAG: Gfo/Idh/MocA family oxidoreductase [Terrimicrobiaceae bacterium]|jgi:predicted dehydrogenase